MNPALLDLLVQTIATIIGGAILFLLGLIYSAITKRTKEYSNWLSKSWRMLLAIALLIFTVYSLFSLTRSFYIAFLSTLSALAVVLIVYHVVDLTEDKVAELFQIQATQIRSLKSDIYMERAYYWETEKIQENVIEYCSKALACAPENYYGFGIILDHIEKALKVTKNDNRGISTFVARQLQDALAEIPKQHSPQLERISGLLTTINVIPH